MQKTNMNFIKGFFPCSWTSLAILGLLSAIIIVNLFTLLQENDRILALKKIMPHQMVGVSFIGLKNNLKNIPSIGYYTNKDLNDDRNAEEFAHAQLVLAPTVLDLNNLNYPYILVVCSNQEAALEIIKRMNAVPLKTNHLGMILAQRNP